MNKHSKLVLSQLGITCLVSMGLNAQESPPGESIEEILVTGSYIKSSPQDAPSPVQVIDRANIEAQGAAQIWDVIKNLEINSGSTTNIGSINEGAGIEGTANINLRNLGQNSTLTLVNGKRQVAAATLTRDGSEFVDINAIPTTMIERLEILQDGGSAIYGSDAIAGVVNIIMRTEFEGFELYGDIQALEGAGSTYDSTISGIWGWASDSGSTNLVMSAEYFEKDPVAVSDAAFFDRNSEFTAAVSGTSFTPLISPALGPNFNTAWINQPLTDINNANRNAVGLADAEDRYTDPLCGDPSLPFNSFTGTRTEQPTNVSASCREDLTRFSQLANGEKRRSFVGSFNHSFSDSLEFYSMFQYSDNKIDRYDDGSVSSLGPQTILPTLGSQGTVPLEVAPGVFFPVSLGDLYFSLGSQAAFAGNTPPVITNAPNSMANGGPNALAFVTSPLDLPRDGGNDQTNESLTKGIQLGFKGDFSFANRDFNYDVSFAHSTNDFVFNRRTVQRQRMELAVNGLGGPNCTPNGRDDYNFSTDPIWRGLVGVSAFQEFFPGYFLNTRETVSQALTSNNQGQGDCQFFNPYLSRFTDPNLANSAELIDWLAPLAKHGDGSNSLSVFDAVVTGDLFELSSGTVQFALGLQYRDQNNKSTAPPLNDPGLTVIGGTGPRGEVEGYDINGVPNQFVYASDDLICSFCTSTYDDTRSVSALFAEFSVPLADTIETQLALRFEDYGGGIGSELSPKFGISWRPIDTVLVRGSYSQSFRAPNIGVVQNGLAASSNRGQDILSDINVRAGLLSPTLDNAELEQVFTVGEPSPDLQNETADTYNIGFQWTPDDGLLEGLSLGMDFWRFEVKNKVTPESVNGALQDELDLFIAAAADTSNYVMNHTLTPGSVVTSCDPNNLPVDPRPQNGGQTFPRDECVVDPITYRIVGVQRALNGEGNLITAVLGTVNAGEVTTDGIDLKAGYIWDTDWGNFSLGLDYTWVNQYELKNVPGLENGLQGTGVTDAAGTTGDGVVVRSLPDHKGHVSLGWNLDNHRVNIISRYIGSYEDLLADGLRNTSNPEVAALARNKISSYNSWDLQYNYSADLFDQTAVFTFGVLDAFEAEVPYRETAGGMNYDTTVIDARGRRIYARALISFN